MKVDNIIIDIILALGVIFMLCMASDDFTLITATIMIVTAVSIWYMPGSKSINKFNKK